MTKRKFYKTIVEVEVLSEEPFADEDLATVQYEITEGHCSGVVNNKGSKALNGKQVANALIKQGSDPEFFQIDDKGNDIE